MLDLQRAHPLDHTSSSGAGYSHFMVKDASIDATSSMVPGSMIEDQKFSWQQPNNLMKPADDNNNNNSNDQNILSLFPRHNHAEEKYDVDRKQAMAMYNPAYNEDPNSMSVKENTEEVPHQESELYDTHRLDVDFPREVHQMNQNNHSNTANLGNPAASPASSLDKSNSYGHYQVPAENTFGVNGGGHRCGFPGCSKIAKDKKTLRKHLLTHREKQFICTYEGCNKKFYERAKLKRHLIVHTGEKPFVCPHEGCGKRFGYKANLKTHMRTHTGVKPFMCTVPGCSRRFAQASNRNSHVLTHQKDNFGQLTSFPMQHLPLNSLQSENVTASGGLVNGIAGLNTVPHSGSITPLNVIPPKSPSYVDVDLLLRFSPGGVQGGYPLDFWNNNAVSGGENNRAVPPAMSPASHQILQSQQFRGYRRLDGSNMALPFLDQQAHQMYNQQQQSQWNGYSAAQQGSEMVASGGRENNTKNGYAPPAETTAIPTSSF